MSNANLDLVRSYLTAFNNGDLASVESLVTGECVQHDPTTPLPGSGPEQTRSLFNLYREVFPDLTFTIHDIFGAGDRVAARWSAAGTQRGELMGIPPTGISGEVTGTSIYRIEEGKLAEIWANWDTLGLLQQLGAIPAPDAA